MSELLTELPSALLLERVRELVSGLNVVEADLLAHLGEVDARRLYLEQGCSSMFVWCLRVLHFAESVAYKRIQAARAARAHPQILEAVRCGDLHLTAVSLLAPKLTKENCAELISAARHKSADQIRQLLADREPRSAVPPAVRKLPTPIPCPHGRRLFCRHRPGRLLYDRHPEPLNRWARIVIEFSSRPIRRRTSSSRSCVR